MFIPRSGGCGEGNCGVGSETWDGARRIGSQGCRQGGRRRRQEVTCARHLRSWFEQLGVVRLWRAVESMLVTSGRLTPGSGSLR